ncbi:MAG: hypothetical protein VX294_00640 [Candidatus Latescibacterota bacterium]|nr:hypothetical protein [Candidatus Latescibacterota bacterium]
MILWIAIATIVVGIKNVDAGEALVTKVRGSVVTIDAGMESGLVSGLSVELIRPPNEEIIHPITGENLGAPEVILGQGAISKTSDRAANVKVNPGLIMAVRPGDIVRFVTPDEGMLIDQERSIVTEEKNDQAHKVIRGEVSRLTKSIKSVQKRIGGLETMMKRVERVEEGFRVQLRSINTDVNTMKDDISDLKESVSLMGAIPIAGLDEEAGDVVDLQSEENAGQIREIVRKLLEEEKANQIDLESIDSALLDEVSLDDSSLDSLDEIEEDEAFYTSWWFIGLFLLIGIGAIAAYVYLYLLGDKEDQDKDEELTQEENPEQVEASDDDLDTEDMEIEDDDIVVEETS